jgi:hypothetical protein
MGDKLGEAKSSGNLGNTLKVMGKFDEAMICCKRHLEISRELKDKVHTRLYCTPRLLIFTLPLHDLAQYGVV